MAALPFRAKIGVVCGNIALTNTDSTIGNSTVNVFSNSILIKVANSTLSMNLGLAHYGLAVGTSVVNSTVLSTGGVTINTTAIAPQNNTTGYVFGAADKLIYLFANNVTCHGSGIYPTTNTSGTSLGSTTQRWILYANSVTASGNVTTTGNVNGAIGYFTGLVNAANFSTTGEVTTGTLTATTSANVGANVQVTTSTITLGSGSGTAAPLISVANSTANVRIYPTALQPGSNAQQYNIGATTLRVQLYANVGNFTGDITAAGAINPTSNTQNLGGASARWWIYANTLQFTSNIISFGTIAPSSNVSGQILGTSTARWVLNANTADFSGVVTSSANVTTSGNVNGAIGYFTGLVNAAHFTTTGSANAGSHYALTGGMYPVNNTTGTALGSTTARWIINANTGNFTGTITTAGGTLESGGVYPTSNTVGTALGSTTQRWVLNANTGNYSGLLTSAGITSTSHVNTSTYFYAGANVYANTTTVRVGNSVVNTEVGNNIVYVGNTTANAHINSTGFFVGGSPLSAGASLNANNTVNDTFYPAMSNTSTGSWTNAVVSTTKLYFNPSTGELSATDFNTLSDATMKQDLSIIKDALNKVDSLNGYTFTWSDNNRRSAGIVAQEVREVLPEIVTSKNTVNYNGLIGLLVQAIKELKDEVKTIKCQTLN